MRRGDAEEDPTHKQVIPYLVLRDGERWFLMRRTKAGGDARLHDRWSIGVGGHLNPGDGDVAGGLRREWAEEVVADFVPDVPARRAAQRRHDRRSAPSTSASCIVADAAGRPVTIRETDKLDRRVRDDRGDGPAVGDSHGDLEPARVRRPDEAAPPPGDRPAG